MTEQQWQHYQELLAALQVQEAIRACVGCWYDTHPNDEAFPGDRVSSSLCPTHSSMLPAARQAPDSLI